MLQVDVGAVAHKAMGGYGVDFPTGANPTTVGIAARAVAAACGRIRAFGPSRRSTV